MSKSKLNELPNKINRETNFFFKVRFPRLQGRNVIGRSERWSKIKREPERESDGR